MPEGPAKALYEWFERRKAQARAIVEHPFHVMKDLFGYRKVSYCGMAKNAARAKTHAALANLYIARRQLLAQGVGASGACARAAAQAPMPLRRPCSPQCGVAAPTLTSHGAALLAIERIDQRFPNSPLKYLQTEPCPGRRRRIS